MNKQITLLTVTLLIVVVLAMLVGCQKQPAPTPAYPPPTDVAPLSPTPEAVISPEPPVTASPTVSPRVTPGPTLPPLPTPIITRTPEPTAIPTPPWSATPKTTPVPTPIVISTPKPTKTQVVTATPTPTLKLTLPPSPTIASPLRSFQLFTNICDQDTGIYIEKGDIITFSASGQWRNVNIPMVVIGPEGVSEGTSGYTTSNFPLPEAARSSLIGRTGGSPYFHIGTSKTITATTSGNLYLGINDRSCNNNKGFLTVDITIVPINPETIRFS